MDFCPLSFDTADASLSAWLCIVYMVWCVTIENFSKPRPRQMAGEISDAV